jgi:hypothetical protein
MPLSPVHPAAIDSARLLAECDVTRTRRSGPGGQNRNKVETAVVLRHRHSGLEAEASERRSQAENLRRALFRLRVKLALAVRRPFVQPSAMWQSRCRGGLVRVSPEHEDFPALLAEAIDALAQSGMDVKEAAGLLTCSPSQLVKLLQAEPGALQQLNQHREQAGLRPLR